jgi:hypothetical protein
MKSFLLGVGIFLFSVNLQSAHVWAQDGSMPPPSFMMSPAGTPDMSQSLNIIEDTRLVYLKIAAQSKSTDQKSLAKARSEIYEKISLECVELIKYYKNTRCEIHTIQFHEGIPQNPNLPPPANPKTVIENPVDVTAQVALILSREEEKAE